LTMKNWRPVLTLALVAYLSAVLPMQVFAAGSVSAYGRYWLPTATKTSTIALPCTQPNQVCKITTTQIDYGHWVLTAPVSRSATSVTTGCTSWYYGSWYQDNYGTNLLGVVVWDDNITDYWGWNGCTAYLSGWTHNAYANVGFTICGGPSVATPWWVGSALHDDETQRFNTFGYCGHWWTNENDTSTNVYGGRNGSSHTY
jgi:hypothetical protein